MTTTTATIGGKAHKFDLDNPLAEGGEARVFDITEPAPKGQQPPMPRVAKIYRQPNDAVYITPAAQAAAVVRLDTVQQKLRDFPKGLPMHAVGPTDLALDKAGKIIGYAMPKVDNAEVLAMWAQPAFRQGIAAATTLPFLRNLHGTIAGLHSLGIVAGDLNDLNVLVRGDDAFVIDLDAASFKAPGGHEYHCRTYTTTFVDPLVCVPDATSGAPVLTGFHTKATDWYAFGIMVARTAMQADPYGGTYRPAAGAPRVEHAARPMKRIPVWAPSVIYPRPSVPLNRMPDDLMQYLARMIEHDERGVFPVKILDNMRWTTCASCGIEHARPTCPQTGCGTAAPAVRPNAQTTQVRGDVTATTLVAGVGAIVRVEVHDGHLMWLAHDGTNFIREDRSVVVTVGHDRSLRYRLTADATFLAMGNQVLEFKRGATAPIQFAVDTVGGAPMFQVTAKHRYWCDGANLYRSGGVTAAAWAHDASILIGSVMARRTRFWMGSEFGFGFARAGGVTHAFVFDATARGIRDGIKIQIKGDKLRDATCVIDGAFAWFFYSITDGARTINRCTLVRRDGTVEATAEAEDGDGSWLGHIRGASAAGGQLFVPTDDGIVRLAAVSGRIEMTRTFPDTQQWVDAGCSLFMGPGCIFVLATDKTKITRISFKAK